ncbi:MAG: autoinducer binding domain-containing protein [Magnetococcales bacterium]|nr:autoinducer binding domain-containing protein [Magnetococcales bacterium]
MRIQPRLKLKELEVTFTSYPKRAGHALSWDEFMRYAPRARSSGDVFQRLVDCLAPMGAMNLVYAYQNGDRLEFHSTLDKGWRDHYQHCGYQNVDPGVRHAWYGGVGPTAMGRAFSRFWNNGFSDSTRRLMPTNGWSRATQDLQEDAADKTGFEIGFMIPLTQQRGMGPAGCSFGSDMKHKEFDQLYQHQGGQIAMVLRAFHDYMQAALQTEKGEELQMLTTRERDVLQMLADGLKRQEIADRISRGKRTVDYAVESARDKLGAGDNDHLAIRRALDLGWIH